MKRCRPRPVPRNVSGGRGSSLVAASRVAALALVLCTTLVARGRAQTVSIEDTTGPPNQFVQVIVDLDSSESVRGLQMTIQSQPHVLFLTQVSPALRAHDFIADAKQHDDGSATVLLVDLYPTVLAPGSGAVMVLSFLVAADATPGVPVSVHASDVRLAGADVEPLSFQVHDGLVVIQTPAPTRTPLATPTPSAPSASPTIAAPSGTPTADSTAHSCVGDCDDDVAVTIDELVRGIRIVEGNETLASCASLDCNVTGRATVDCLVRAVSNALGGCR